MGRRAYSVINSDTSPQQYPPEIKLIVYTLEWAIRDALCKPESRKRYGRGELVFTKNSLQHRRERIRDRNDARKWLFEPSDKRQPFSFAWCCEALGQCPVLVRRRVQKLIDSNFDIDATRQAPVALDFVVKNAWVG